MHILLVEDDIDTSETLVECLHHEGYSVTCASDGAEALRLLGKGDLPDLILLDLMLSGMDGWDFRAAQKRDPSIAHIPVIAVSAAGRLTDAETLRKPVRVDQLLEAIRAHLEPGRAGEPHRSRLMTRPPTKVLVVDDDADTRDVLRELLEGEGYRVATAGNGREALTTLEREPGTCAILLDLMMPVMDGWHFLQVRREDERLSQIPVIIISAYRERAALDGVAGVVGKPIAFDTLLTLLHQQCQERGRE
ncbi:MAG TPA: response regulator [Vicinamibacterales bacterium]|nr:response regulator [Vicinamibacterales bacterium]